MTKIDDVTLIRKFIQGELTLLANHNLRVEPAFNTAQLLAKRGELLASAKLVGQIRSILVRQSSVYEELISRILSEHRYIPTHINEQGLIQYEPCPIPDGYELNYTEVRQLWKIWRVRYCKHDDLQRNRPRKPDAHALLIQHKKGWAPIVVITYGQENFFIEIPGDEIMLHSSDRIVWLNPVQKSDSSPQ